MKNKVINLFHALFNREENLRTIMMETHAFLEEYETKHYALMELLELESTGALSDLINKYRSYLLIDQELNNESKNGILPYGDFSNINYRDLVRYIDRLEAYTESVVEEMNPGIKTKVYQKPLTMFRFSKTSKGSKVKSIETLTIESISDVFKMNLSSDYCLLKVGHEAHYIYININGSAFVFNVPKGLETESGGIVLKIYFAYLSKWVEDNYGLLKEKCNESVSFEDYFGIDRLESKSEAPWHSQIGSFFIDESGKPYEFSAEDIKNLYNKTVKSHETRKIITYIESEKEPGFNKVEFVRNLLSNRFFGEVPNDEEIDKFINMIELIRSFKGIKYNHKEINRYAKLTWYKEKESQDDFYNRTKWNVVKLNHGMVGSPEFLEGYKTHLICEKRSDLKFDLHILRKIMKQIYFMTFDRSPNLIFNYNASSQLEKVIKTASGIHIFKDEYLLENGCVIVQALNQDNVETILSERGVNVDLALPDSLILFSDSFKNEAVIDYVFRNYNGLGKRIIELVGHELKVHDFQGGLNVTKMDARIDVSEVGSLVRLTKVYERVGSSYTQYYDTVQSKTSYSVQWNEVDKRLGIGCINLDVANLYHELLFGNKLFEINEEYTSVIARYADYAFNSSNGTLFSRYWYHSGVTPGEVVHLNTEYFFDHDGQLVDFYYHNADKIKEYNERWVFGSINYRVIPIEAFVDCSYQFSQDDIKKIKTGTHGVFRSPVLEEKHFSKISKKLSEPHFIGSKAVKIDGNDEVVFCSTKKNARARFETHDEKMHGMLGKVIEAGKRIIIETEFGEIVEFNSASIKNSNWFHLSTVNIKDDIMAPISVEEKIKKRNEGYKLFIKHYQDTLDGNGALKLT